MSFTKMPYERNVCYGHRGRHNCCSKDRYLPIRPGGPCSPWRAAWPGSPIRPLLAFRTPLVRKPPLAPGAPGLMWLTHVPLTVREVLQRLVVPPILALPAGSEAQLGSEDNGNDNDHNANDNDYNGNNNNHNANDNDNKGDGG